MSALHFNSAPRENHSANRELFEFLTDFRNFSLILPADRVSDFKLTDEGCVFNIQGVAALKAKIESQSPHSEIIYLITGPARTELHLRVHFIKADNKEKSEVELAAHLNPVLKMMAEKPLKSLVNTIGEKLAALNLQSIHEN